MAPNLVPGLKASPWVYIHCPLVREMWVDGQQDDAGVEGLMPRFRAVQVMEKVAPVYLRMIISTQI
jgi:hypothetical protein